ncbi:MAG: hypothetical protein R6W87_12015 [Halospina sp.]
MAKHGKEEMTIFNLRVPKAEKARWQDAAKASGESASSVARDALGEWADKVLRGNNGK